MSLFETYLKKEVYSEAKEVSEKQIIDILKTGNFSVYYYDKGQCTLISKKVSENTANFLGSDPSDLDEEELTKYKKLSKDLTIIDLNEHNGSFEVGYCGDLTTLLIKALGGKPYSI